MNMHPVPLAATLALALLAAPAAAQTRQNAEVHMSQDEGFRALQEAWGFSDVVVVDGVAYLSGAVAMRPAPGEDLATAFERLYAEIGTTLGRIGAGWDDVVDITSYHTDIVAQLPAMAEVHKRHVRAPYPAWTAVSVVRLLPDDGITEVKVVAHVKPRVRQAAGEGGD